MGKRESEIISPKKLKKRIIFRSNLWMEEREVWGLKRRESSTWN